MQREQLNVRLQRHTKRQVQTDRAKFSKTNDIVVEVALQAWFSSHTPDQRAKFYAAHDHKPFGRSN